jgi:hypothetical protein
MKMRPWKYGEMVFITCERIEIFAEVLKERAL